MNNTTPYVILFTQYFFNVVVVVIAVVVVADCFYRFVLPNCEAKSINCSNSVLLSQPTYCCGAFPLLLLFVISTNILLLSLPFPLQLLLHDVTHSVEIPLRKYKRRNFLNVQTFSIFSNIFDTESNILSATGEDDEKMQELNIESKYERE